jgi:hypothetical protein
VTRERRVVLLTELPSATATGRPGAPLWTFEKAGVEWSAEVRFHGGGVGSESQIFRNAEFVAGRRFILGEEAIGWAEAQRTAIEKGDV